MISKICKLLTRRKNKKKQLERKKELQKIMQFINSQLNKDRFNELTNSMIIEQLKEKFPETWEKEYLENLKQIEKKKDETYDIYSKILKSIYEVILKEIDEDGDLFWYV